MKARKILIATSSFGTYDPDVMAMLRQQKLDPVVNPLGRSLSSAELLKYAKGCVGIIAGTEPYDAETLARLKDLQVLSRCGAGMDSIDIPAAERLGIQLYSTPFGPTQAVAELTVGVLLNLIRTIDVSSAALKLGLWEKPMGFLLEEMKIGILGLGKIGQRVASILRRFDAAVWAHDINPDKAWAAAHGVSLRERTFVIAHSDVLCLHLPYEKSLHHLIGRAELDRMTPGSFLINTSRGGLIDENALYDALKRKHLRGAALDTFEKEPYTGPLRELPNVILTPHIGSYARAARVKMERECAEHLLEGLRR